MKVSVAGALKEGLRGWSPILSVLMPPCNALSPYAAILCPSVDDEYPMRKDNFCLIFHLYYLAQCLEHNSQLISIC